MPNRRNQEPNQESHEEPSGSIREDDGESSSYSSSSSCAKKPHRTSKGGRRSSTNFNDFRVEIPEFEGKLDPYEFVEWLSTVERIFDYKEIPEDKKVKLVVLKLRKYASLWWTNLCDKRVRNLKEKIRTW